MQDIRYLRFNFNKILLFYQNVDTSKLKAYYTIMYSHELQSDVLATKKNKK